MPSPKKPRLPRADAMLNLGRNLKALALTTAASTDTERGTPSAYRDAKDQAFGEEVNGLLRAGIKAGLAGQQSDAQAEPILVEVREAINRKAARHVRRRPVG